MYVLLLPLLVVFSVVMFVGSLIAIPILLARMPADYFARDEPPFAAWRRRHPVVGGVLAVARNLLGAVLLLAGLAMMILPGQGVITILVALTLLDFPGKRRLELSIIRQRPVRGGIDWIRRKAGQPPLIIPDPPSPR